MPYITRQDGERFVIPSYRDILSAKRGSQLKRDILQLSTNYGGYITLQRRNLTQYEIAFSPDAGYLLGECIWNFLKRPADMVYCEAIPDTTEAILVIVKDGGVYLDGTFPVESIAEELLVFKTQKSAFEIFVYGDVPISEQPEEGKFSFDATSVKSFNVMPEPIFPTLPGVKVYQLQLVDVVLRQHGIGVFPLKAVLGVLVVVGLIWMGYSYINMEEKQMPVVVVAAPRPPPPPPNPFKNYNAALASPEPSDALEQLAGVVAFIHVVPGWVVTDVNYTPGSISGHLVSQGANSMVLYNWAQENNVTVTLNSSGFILQMALPALTNRPIPTLIYSLDRVVANVIDRVATALVGNVVQVSAYANKGAYGQATVTIQLAGASPGTLMLLAEQLKNLPLALTNISLKIDGNLLTGTINLQALGN